MKSPEEFNELIKSLLKDDVKNTTCLYGGSINDTFKVELRNGEKVFVKLKSSLNSDVFIKEANCLNELKKAGTIRIPDVIYFDEHVLITEFIETGKKTKDFFFNFGKSFAGLHNYKNESFGFYEDNYIGSTPQINSYSKDWVEFYFKNRILFQYELAVRNNNATEDLKKLIYMIGDKISVILGPYSRKPSLLHGDLWNGNYLIDINGKAGLIDPAVYYGDPEADLAMTKLFGGFDKDFYEGYLSVNRLPEGYEYRENVYKLYHVLNHFNLFGGSYYIQAIEILKYYA